MQVERSITLDNATPGSQSLALGNREKFLSACSRGSLWECMAFSGKSLPLTQMVDKYGRSGLHLAAFSLKDSLVQLLLDELNFPVDIKDKSGWTPLCWCLRASANSAHEVNTKRRTLELLLLHGASFEQCSRDVTMQFAPEQLAFVESAIAKRQARRADEERRIAREMQNVELAREAVATECKSACMVRPVAQSLFARIFGPGKSPTKALEAPCDAAPSSTSDSASASTSTTPSTSVSSSSSTSAATSAASSVSNSPLSSIAPPPFSHSASHSHSSPLSAHPRSRGPAHLSAPSLSELGPNPNKSKIKQCALNAEHGRNPNDFLDDWVLIDDYTSLDREEALLSPDMRDMICASRCEGWYLSLGTLKVVQRIGAGTSGVVFLGKLHGIGDVAVKSFMQLSPMLMDAREKPDERALREFMGEARVLHALQHDSIVRFYGAVVDFFGESRGVGCALVMEYCAKGSLYAVLHDRVAAAEVTWRRMFAWMRELADAVRYLHERDPVILHRDLKSLNVLLDANGKVKLADFGVSLCTPQFMTMAKAFDVGTPIWMAPEVLDQIPYNRKADVYSYAIIMWEMLTGMVPYEGCGQTTFALIPQIVQGKRPDVPEWAPKGMVALMTQCWNQDPDARPSFAEVCRKLDEEVGPEMMEMSDAVLVQYRSPSYE